MRFDLRVGSRRTSGPFLVPAVPVRRGYRPYFENYTVDASILKKTLCMPFGVCGVLNVRFFYGSAHVISSL